MKMFLNNFTRSSYSIIQVIINLSWDICFVLCSSNSKMLLRFENLLLALMLNLVDSNYEDADFDNGSTIM